MAWSGMYMRPCKCLQVGFTADKLHMNTKEKYIYVRCGNACMTNTFISIKSTDFVLQTQEMAKLSFSYKSFSSQKQNSKTLHSHLCNYKNSGLPKHCRLK